MLRKLLFPCFFLAVGILPATNVVQGAPVNLAFGKNTYQSSTYSNDPIYDSSKGVDGSKSDSSMFHTGQDPQPWWEVDLGRSYAIDNVLMYNRIGCCGERVAQIQVWISQDRQNYDLVYQHDNYAFRDRRAEIGGLEARYIRLVIPRSEYLHLQEVEVYQYGTWTPPSSRASVIRRANVSSIGGAPSGGSSTAAIGSWLSAGTGDCPGRDVSGSNGPNPDPAKCTAQFAGFTAVCWNNSCTYKNLATASCIGGASPGRMYTCGASSISGMPDLSGRWTVNANGFTFRADIAQRDRRITGTLTPINNQAAASSIEGSFDGREINFVRTTPGAGSQQYHGYFFNGIEAGKGLAGTFQSQDGLNYGWYASR